MKKLQIIFFDGSSITYTIKEHIDWQQYYTRHSLSSMKSAILFQSPYSKNEPVVLVGPDIETSLLCEDCEEYLVFSRALSKKRVLYYRYRCPKCKRYFNVRQSVDCNQCAHISITEGIQNAICTGSKPDHVCTKFNKRVLHGSNHPELRPIARCRLTDSFEKRE